MPKLNANALDLERLEGVWWDFDTGMTCAENKPHETHGCFLVVPHVGSRYDIVLAEEQLPFLELLRQGSESEERRAEIFRDCKAKAMARTILKGWANWEQEDGTPLEYSEQEAVRLLTDRRFLIYAQFVERCAQSTEAAIVREEGKARGN